MRSLFLLLVMCYSFAGQSQGKKINDLFDQAKKQYEDSLYQDAIQTFRKIRKIATYNSEGYAKASYNLAYTYTLLQKTDSAIRVYEEILDSDFDEMDPGGPGSGIMADPYALYKHNSCENLAEIYLDRKNYSKALTYIKKFDETYPFRHFCGNAFESNDIYKAMMYAGAYAGLGDTLTAIQKLLPRIIETGLADNQGLVDAAIALLKKKYDACYLKDEIEKSINGVYEKKIGSNGAYAQYFIKFLDTEIPIPSYFDFDKKTRVQASQLTEAERRILFLKQTRFYKAL